MKKEYIRPEAEKISFQTEEVMTDSFTGNGGNVVGELTDWPAQNP